MPLTSHQNITRNLLNHLKDKGYTLEQCADKRVMNREVDTLKKWCRKFNIVFPDYDPGAHELKLEEARKKREERERMKAKRRELKENEQN